MRRCGKGYELCPTFHSPSLFFRNRNVLSIGGYDYPLAWRLSVLVPLAIWLHSHHCNVNGICCVTYVVLPTRKLLAFCFLFLSPQAVLRTWSSEGSFFRADKGATKKMAEEKDRGNWVSRSTCAGSRGPYLPQTPYLCINFCLIRTQQFGVFLL